MFCTQLTMDNVAEMFCNQVIDTATNLLTIISATLKSVAMSLYDTIVWCCATKCTLTSPLSSKRLNSSFRASSSETSLSTSSLSSG